MPGAGKSRREATRRAVAETARAGDAREVVRPRGKRQTDPITGELRRRDVLPLLVLHFMEQGPTYGNQLMERISRMTEGVLTINPNTMYPLLRALEAGGLIEGRWEHPERRSRRYYSLTEAGRAEYRRLHEDVRPFLDSTARSISEIVREVYGGE